MNKGLFVLSLLCIAVNQAIAADEMTIEVEAGRLAGTDRFSVDTDEAVGTASDGGDYLTGVNGVAGSRLGGHGIDPSIRGQSQNRINVLLDGAYLYGGCPNRMDPPSSYASLESYDKVTVLKGNQSVIYGGGGSGGTVLFERETPRLEPGEGYRAKFGGGYASNGAKADAFVDVTGGAPLGFARVIGEAKEADSYKDGDGEEVRSGFSEHSANLILGYTPDDHTRLELGTEAVRGRDIEFFGSMDSPVSDSDTVRLKFSREAMAGTFSGIEAELYQSDVYHVMDNYSVDGREPPTMVMMGNTMQMRMEVPSDSVTRGGRVSGDLLSGAHQWKLGLDYQHSNRDAIMRSSSRMLMMGSWGAWSPWTESNFLWPDVDIKQTGLFAEMQRPLSPTSDIKVGLRYDLVEAKANKADVDPAAMGDQTPNTLYQQKYGIIADTHEENNLGGFIRYSRDISEKGSWFINLGRSVRTADATERYLAKRASMPAQDWVGNPAIDPEIHHQLELGTEQQHGMLNIAASLHYDRIGDYILKQSGTAGTLYNNVDAVIYGAELESRLAMGGNWSTSFTLAYLHGDNTSDGKPLPQIAPLEASLGLDYRSSGWSLGGKVRGVNEQTRTDTAGGDVNEVTPGYAVVDLNGSYALGKRASLGVGIDNLLDRTYTEHLNREDAFSGQNVAANEPGRSLWVKASMRF